MKKTLGSAFGEIRREKGMTLAEVGLKCGVHESTVCNVERDRPIRWETVHLVLTKGMKIKSGSAVYQSCHELWLKQRAEVAASHPEDFAAKTLSKHATEAVRKFRNLVRELDPEQTKKVLAAAQRSARSF